MLNFARRNTYSNSTLFLTFARGDKQAFDAIKRKMKGDHLAKGVNVVVISLRNKAFK